MSVSVTVRRGPIVGTQDLGVSRTLTSGQLIQISEPVPDASTDLQIAFAALAAKIQAIAFLCDQAVTVETNSGSAPDQTITLAAGVPKEWATGDLATNPITDDIASLFVTNASGEDATLTVVALVDPT